MAAEPGPVLLTGAGGFVGAALVRALAARSRAVIATDRTAMDFAGLPSVTAIPGELDDPALIARLAARPISAVVHLATVPGGAAEAEPALAARVNLAAAMALFDATAAHGNVPRLLFASSIAVFGDALPPHVDDTTPPRPMLRYGAHKAMLEEWVATLTRRGAVRGLSVRLPGIVARPAAPSGMKSAFLSNLFHALKAGEPITLPVSAEATAWLLSRRALVEQLATALDCPADPPSTRLNLPALRVRMGDLVEEVARQTGADPSLAGHDPDPTIEAAFGAQPPLATPAADALGLVHDGDLSALVSRALADL
ncbi:NAD-dependent epimerase/dehydratase family protein [Erythrobacter sp. WG]|uniref:NAD-dependent epimerase/dehydratase family protein n=1 Tax=Erythrobacter sp. WG TaxID=2985510 RepID=UPI0022712AC7|nr:NAD-dependent epimerase/dehydratase family protein [Erythrobacter sp. WG]MCX9146543.1 NAD-dependent epimerase/dehydratase family protein [Erythrobacter sp. WG]